MGNQNPYIEDEQTTQWPKAKHTHKTRDRITRAPQRTGGKFRCSGMISSSCPTNDTHRVGTRRNAYTVTLRTPIYSTHTIDWHGITSGFGGGGYGVQHHFNNISVISWWSCLLAEKTGENHRPVASH